MIIYKDWSNIIRRLPSDKQPRFVPAHSERKSILSLTDPTKTREVAENVADTIRLPNDSMLFKRGICNRVRTAQDDDAAKIERLETEIAKLQAELHNAKERAYIRGRPITKAQAQEWSKPK